MYTGLQKDVLDTVQACDMGVERQAVRPDLSSVGQLHRLTRIPVRFNRVERHGLPLLLRWLPADFSLDGV